MQIVTIWRRNRRQNGGGRGTSFEIWLPLAAEAGKPAVETERELKRGHVRGDDRDDEPMLVALAPPRRCSPFGYEPVGFIRAMRRARISELNRSASIWCSPMRRCPTRGYELAGEIRRIRPGVPVGLMSGHGGVGWQNRGRRHRRE